MKKLHYLAYALLVNVTVVFGNNLSEYEKQYFIDSYAYQAINEMEYSGIPASITMAQAILESGWGKGTVAKEANNYFCIKCHNDWNGETFNAKDDEPGLSCFRKYSNVVESFKDHSEFLMNGSRYQPLFLLDKRDFRGWCNGLKKYGYATDPAYSDKLINLIEYHGLWVFDLAIPTKSKPTIEPPKEEPSEKINTGIAAQSESVNVAPSSKVSRIKKEPATNLALPFYHFRTSDRTQSPTRSESTLQPKPTMRKRMKIRPILPHPEVRFDHME